MRFWAVVFILSTVCLKAVSVALAADETPVASPSPQRFLGEVDTLTTRLLDDYRVFLEKYYELKKKSATPAEFTVALARATPGAETAYGVADANGVVRLTKLSLDEFSYEEYRKLQAQIDADPVLAKNEFLRRLKAIGFGNANDVFQRVGGEYAIELPGASRSMIVEHGQNAAGFALEEAKRVFNEVSAQAGYSLNFKPYDAGKSAKYVSRLQSAAVAPCADTYAQIGRVAK